jgi:hypothetical protein
MSHNVFWWIGATCTMSTFVLLYVQSTVGDDDHSVREKLLNWYRYVDEGDWTRIPVFALRSTERFFAFLFGSSIISVRSLVTAGGLAFFVSFLGYYLSQLETQVHEPWHALTFTLSLLFSSGDWSLFLVTVLVDVASLVVMRLYIRNIVEHSRHNVVFDLLFMVLFSLAAVYLSMFMVSFFPMMLESHFGLKNAFALFRRMEYWLRGSHGHDSDSTIVMRLYFLPAAFSAFVVTSICAVSASVYATRPLTQKPLANLLEGLAKSKLNLMALVTGFIGAVSMLVGLFQS